MSYPVFTSRYSLGLTFVSWSYHWLSGHNYSWNAKNGNIAIPENPNTGINAHYFTKNYCAGYQEWANFLSDEKNNVENCSMYGGVMWTDDNTKSYQINKSIVDQDYAACLKLASLHNPLIFFVENPNESWYFLYKRGIEVGDIDHQHSFVHNLVRYQDLHTKKFLTKYFHNSLRSLDQHIWDLRELIALNFDYFKVSNCYLNNINRDINHLYIDSNDLWYNGEECLERIFKYLNKKTDATRLEHWRKVYHEWQSTQLKILKFNWYLPVIVDSIIHNYNFDLDFLNLTLLQEAVIQGHLIKYHNQNLKCYGLEKFPSNTKDLHLLLEESTHP
jgi:hypothetical protein